MNPSPATLVARSLVNNYNKRPVVRDVSPAVQAGEIVGPGFHSNGFARSRVVQHVDGEDAPAGQLLDFDGPARRHVAGLHPVVDHRAVELDGAGDLRLAPEHPDQSHCAVHAGESN